MNPHSKRQYKISPKETKQHKTEKVMLGGYEPPLGVSMHILLVVEQSDYR
jgi:hypothetical protein